MVFLFAAIGLSLGSFGNVLLHRIAAGENIGGRSRCPSCRRVLAARDLVPILSYIVLRGRCRRCKAAISLRYPLVEAGSMGLFLFALALFGHDPLRAYFTGVALYFLFLLCVYDGLHQEIPDVLTLLLALTAATLTVLYGDVLSSLMGAVIAILWFGGQWAITRGRSVGSGDIFLGAALGVWLGALQTIAMLVLSYVVGAVCVLALLATGFLSAADRRIAFGPFLGVGTLLSLLGVGAWYVRVVFGA